MINIGQHSVYSSVLTTLNCVGQHSVYCFPVRPTSDISIQKKNLAVRKTLKEKEDPTTGETLLHFLQTCLPAATAKKCGPGNDKDGVYLYVQ